MSAVLDAAYRVVHGYPGGADALGARMKKSGTTLSHEVKGTGTAKFGLVDAVTATVFSGDYDIINTFAAECGGMFIPLPATVEGDDGSMLRLSKLAKEFSDLVASVTAAKADGKVTANELAHVDREWAQLVSVGQSLMAYMRSVHEAGIPQGGAS